MGKELDTPEFMERIKNYIDKEASFHVRKMGEDGVSVLHIEFVEQRYDPELCSDVALFLAHTTSKIWQEWWVIGNDILLDTYPKARVPDQEDVFKLYKRQKNNLKGR